jgi:hypothetical protein
MSVQPNISVCLPNLNNARWLPERLDSILAQDYTDFELVISDNFSDDGAWELFRTYARRDSRILIAQAPRAGMYANWNNCLARARGRWIYVATSDDTMRPNCLRRLLEAGEGSGAEVVTSPEWLIDGAGADLPVRRSIAHQRLLCRAEGRPGWLDPRREVLGALLFGTPSTSITQLLIHHSVFAKTGSFPTQYQSFGDFHWQVNALRKCRWFHVPEQLGAWRVHPTQATPADVGRRYVGRAAMAVDLWRDSILWDEPAFRCAVGYAVGLADDVDISVLPAQGQVIARFVRSFTPTWRPRIRHILAPIVARLAGRAVVPANAFVI